MVYWRKEMFIGTMQKVSLPPAQCGCVPMEFIGADNALCERHLLFDNIIEPACAW